MQEVNPWNAWVPGVADAEYAVVIATAQGCAVADDSHRQASRLDYKSAKKQQNNTLL